MRTRLWAAGCGGWPSSERETGRERKGGEDEALRSTLASSLRLAFLELFASPFLLACPPSIFTLKIRNAALGCRQCTPAVSFRFNDLAAREPAYRTAWASSLGFFEADSLTMRGRADRSRLGSLAS